MSKNYWINISIWNKFFTEQFVIISQYLRSYESKTGFPLVCEATHKSRGTISILFGPFWVNSLPWLMYFIFYPFISRSRTRTCFHLIFFPLFAISFPRFSFRVSAFAFFIASERFRTRLRRKNICETRTCIETQTGESCGFLNSREARNDLHVPITIMSNTWRHIVPCLLE